MAKLPERYRGPLVAHFLEQQPQEAIARELGISRPAVSYRVAKGVELVRKNLRRSGVTVGAATLSSAIMEAASAEAVPGSLKAGVGKIAVAGGAAVKSGVVLAGGLLSSLMLKSVAAGVAVLVMAVGWLAATRGEDEAPAQPVAKEAVATLGDGSQLPESDTRVADLLGAGGEQEEGEPCAVSGVVEFPEWRREDRLVKVIISRERQEGEKLFYVETKVAPGEVFTFDDLLPGAYSVQAWLNHASPLFDVLPGQTRELGQIVLTKGGMLRGTTTFPDGRPAIGRLKLLAVSEDVKRLAEHGNLKLRCRVDRANGGAYEIDGIVPGRYRVRMDKEDTPHEVQIVNGETTVLDFVVPLTSALKASLEEAEKPTEGEAVIAGRVVWDNAEPVAEARVEISGPTRAEMKGGADGAFRFEGLRADAQFEVEVRAGNDYQEEKVTPREDIRVVMRRPAKIVGRLQRRVRASPSERPLSRCEPASATIPWVLESRRTVHLSSAYRQYLVRREARCLSWGRSSLPCP